MVMDIGLQHLMIFPEGVAKPLITGKTRHFRVLPRTSAYKPLGG